MKKALNNFGYAATFLAACMAPSASGHSDPLRGLKMTEAERRVLEAEKQLTDDAVINAIFQKWGNANNGFRWVLEGEPNAVPPKVKFRR